MSFFIFGPLSKIAYAPMKTEEKCCFLLFFVAMRIRNHHYATKLLYDAFQTSSTYIVHYFLFAFLSYFYRTTELHIVI